MISQGTALAASIITARILGLTQFGELGIINANVGMLGVFAGVGLGVTATKYVAQYRDQDPSRAGRMIGFLSLLALICGGFVALLVAFFADTFSSLFLQAPHLATALQISCLLVLFNTLNGIQIGALSGLESFRSIALASLVNGAGNLVLIPLGAGFGKVEGAIAGYVLTSGASWIFYHWVLHNQCRRIQIRIVAHATADEWRAMWEFAIPALLISMSTQPFAWLIRIFLTNQPNGYAEMGLFTAAFAWSNLLLFVPMQISRPSMPVLSNLYAAQDPISATKVLRTNFTLTIGISVLTAVPLIILSPYIMRAYGDTFGQGTLVLIVIIIAFTIGAGTLVFRDAISAIGAMWWFLIISASWGVTLCLLAFAFIDMGALGIAFAYLISYVFLFGIELWFVSSRHLTFNLFAKPQSGN